MTASPKTNMKPKYWGFYMVYFGLSPLPVTVTIRIITFLVGDPELNLHLPQLLGGGTTQGLL